MVNTKNAFWQALIFAIIVFGIGLLFGFFLEDSRTQQVELALKESEINLLDQQIRSRGIQQFNINCKEAKKSTLNFADDIYQEARTLEIFDGQSKFTNDLKTLHKQYDLLRTILWIEGIELKENCAQELHTVTYLFEYASEEIQTQAQQATLSRLLLDLKNKHGDQILLIPIAANLELESIELIKKRYGITQLPAIIIDETKIVKNAITLDQLEQITFEQNGFEELEGTIFTQFPKKTSNKDPIILN